MPMKAWVASARMAGFGQRDLAEAGFLAPDGDEDLRRHAVALLDRGERSCAIWRGGRGPALASAVRPLSLK